MPLERSPRFPSLLVVSPDGAERLYMLGLSEITIGRDRDCEVVLDDGQASRRHARLTLAEQRVSVEDLGSRNGTFLNGTRLDAGAAPLSHGDRLTISRTELRFVDPSSDTVASVPESGEERETRLTAALATGSLGRTLAAAPNAADSPEADAALLRVVVGARSGFRLVIRQPAGTREVTLEGSAMTIGRASRADIVLQDSAVSATHARLCVAEGVWRIEDLGSTNGLSVNGVTVALHPLREGDTIRIGSAVLVFKEDRSGSAPRDARKRPVVLVPGFGGTELHSRGERLWPNLPRLLGTSERRLRDYWAQVDVGSIVREVSIVPGLFKLESFGRLVSFLTDDLGYRPGEDLLEFPYDWRTDVRSTAQDLAEAVGRWRAHRDRPAERVVLLAHSMGGLVGRHWIAGLGGAAVVERAIFLGTPHLGSARSLMVVLANERSRPLGLALGRLHVILKGLPSLYHLLPGHPVASFEDGSELDILAADDWLDPAFRPFLRSAVERRRELDRAWREVRLPVTSVFGYGRRTLEHIRLRRRPDGTVDSIGEEFTDTGDGTVAEGSAVLEGSEIHPVEQEHGVLHADRDVLRRVRFELTER